MEQDSSNKSIEESDAELAKRLAEEYDAELAKRLAEEDEEFPVFPYEDEPVDYGEQSISVKPKDYSVDTDTRKVSTLLTNPDSANESEKQSVLDEISQKYGYTAKGETVEDRLEDLFDHLFDLAEPEYEDTNQNNSRPIDSSEAEPSGSGKETYPESIKEAGPSGSGKETYPESTNEAGPSGSGEKTDPESTNEAGPSSSGPNQYTGLSGASEASKSNGSGLDSKDIDTNFSASLPESDSSPIFIYSIIYEKLILCYEYLVEFVKYFI